MTYIALHILFMLGQPQEAPVETLGPVPARATPLVEITPAPTVDPALAPPPDPGRVAPDPVATKVIMYVTPEPAAGVLPSPYDEAATGREWSRLRARQRLGRRLTAGGFAGLGAAFFGNLFGAVASGTVGEDPSSIAALLPVAGPFVAAAWQDPGAHGWRAFFVLDGLAQVAFLAMGVTGVAINKRSGRALAQPRFVAIHGRLERRLDTDPDLVRRGRLGLGLGLGGFGGFGLAYLGANISMFAAESETLLTSKTDVQRAWVALPVAGPFVIAGQADLAGTRALMAILGVIQVGSLATGITGAVIRGRRMRDAESRVLHDVGVAPWHSGTTTGLSLRGRF